MTLMNHCTHKQKDLKDVNILPGRSHGKGRGLLPQALRARSLAHSLGFRQLSWGKLHRGRDRCSRRSATESQDAHELRLCLPYDVLLSTYLSKANLRRKKKKKAPRAYFMPAVLLINWGIETCAGNHNKENVTKAEILPWKNPRLCLEASTGRLQSGHMTPFVDNSEFELDQMRHYLPFLAPNLTELVRMKWSFTWVDIEV